MLEVLLGVVILLIVLVLLSGKIGIIKDGTTRARIVIVLIVIALPLGWKSFDQYRKYKRERINAFISTTLNGLKSVPPEKGTGNDPYLTGKLLLVDKETEAIDPLFYQLPLELRASNPSEVGTIVLLKWRQEGVGYYTGTNKTAKQWHCDVEVIDFNGRRSLVEKDIIGHMPPNILTKGDTPEGYKPDKKVIDFLTSLPRRSA